jgi:CRP-like cAMP-binding protein
MATAKASATVAATADDRARMHAALARDGDLAADDAALMDPHVRVRQLARGAYFLRPGDPATWCGTITHGLVREFYPLEDGREATRGFAGPGSYVGSLSDLLLGAPSRSAVIAELDARIVVMPWARVRAAAAARPAWAAFLARIVERVYLAKAEREYELLALDAEARYRRFLARYAALEPSIPQRHVASYIGVTPEHLSRLRRRLAADAGSTSRARTRR